jgi:hypothetical protein
MKRAITVLAVLLMAATTYTQTSRRTASTTRSAKSGHGTTQTSRSNNTSNRSSATRVNSNQGTTRSTTSNRNSSIQHHNSGNANRNSNNPVHRTGTTTRTTDGNRTTHTTTRTTNTPSRSVNRTTTTTSRPGNKVNRTTTTTHSTPAHSVNRTTTEHSHRTYPAERYTTSRVYCGQQHSKHVYRHEPYTKAYRAKHYVYREPVHVHVVWTRKMHHYYVDMYPHVRHWGYSYGYSIGSVSAYYADYYIGDVKTVYGRVKEVFYSRETDEFFLNIGDYYPYQDFTIVLPGYIAREYTRRPVSYFTNQYVDVTGLITEFDGKPEIVVKRRFQLDVY